jgi:hypothetical protein
MSIRTTVTLDDDVLERVKQESQARGASLRDTLHELVRSGLFYARNQTVRTLKIEATPMGLKPGLSLDNIEALLEYGEGAWHR